MTQIPIETQFETIAYALATDTVATGTISSVDISRSFISLRGHSMGNHGCDTCFAQILFPVGVPKGTGTDGKTINSQVRFLNSTTVEISRPTPVGVGCRMTVRVYIVEYT